MVTVESGADPHAIRYEPDFYRRYLSPERIKAEHRDHAEMMADAIGCTFDTEIQGRAFSWGPLQVMGQVARENGFRGWFTELCEPEAGLRMGAQHFQRFYLRYGNTQDAIAAYNAGSPRRTPGGLYVNEGYVDKVMREYRLLQG